jgi:hypothetical protein
MLHLPIVLALELAGEVAAELEEPPQSEDDDS